MTNSPKVPSSAGLGELTDFERQGEREQRSFWAQTMSPGSARGTLESLLSQRRQVLTVLTALNSLALRLIPAVKLHPAPPTSSPGLIQKRPSDVLAAVICPMIRRRDQHLLHWRRFCRSGGAFCVQGQRPPAPPLLCNTAQRSRSTTCFSAASLLVSQNRQLLPRSLLSGLFCLGAGVGSFAHHTIFRVRSDGGVLSS